MNGKVVQSIAQAQTRMAPAMSLTGYALMVALAIIPTSSLLSTTAEAQLAGDHGIIDLARSLDGMCRGSPGDTPNLDQICAIRDEAFAVANRMGFCYGKKGQYGAQMRWHRCTKESIR